MTASNYIHPAQYFAITRDCENPELAAQWIDFYINNRQANEIMGVDRGMPVNGIMVDAVWDQLSADDRESIAYVREMVEPASSTINPPSPAKAVKVNAAIMPGIQEQLLYRRVDARQASRMFVDQASDAMRQ